MALVITAFVGGLIVGIVGTILLSKNNKNTIAKLRSEILDAASKGEQAVKEVVNRYS